MRCVLVSSCAQPQSAASGFSLRAYGMPPPELTRACRQRSPWRVLLLAVITRLTGVSPRCSASGNTVHLHSLLLRLRVCC